VQPYLSVFTAAPFLLAQTVFIFSSNSFPQSPSADLLWIWGQWSVQDWMPGE